MLKFKCSSGKFCGGFNQDFDPADENKVVEIFPWMASVNKQLCPSCVREVLVKKMHPENKLKQVTALVAYDE